MSSTTIEKEIIPDTHGMLYKLTSDQLDDVDLMAIRFAGNTSLNSSGGCFDYNGSFAFAYEEREDAIHYDLDQDAVSNDPEHKPRLLIHIRDGSEVFVVDDFKNSYQARLTLYRMFQEKDQDSVYSMLVRYLYKLEERLMAEK